MHCPGDVGAVLNSTLTIHRWAARRLGRPDGRLTVAGLTNLPREVPLRYAEGIGSPLGGRLSGHLAHLDAAEITRLTQKADGFLAGAEPVDERVASAAPDPRDASDRGSQDVDATA